MKAIIKISSILLFSLLFMSNLLAQQHTQTIRGAILDKESQMPLIGADISVERTIPLKGTTTDLDGNFRLEGVEIGRQSLIISYIGYEPQKVSNLEVTSGKEIVLNIELSESPIKLDEVVVRADEDRTQLINEMAIASARSFSVEETGRYAFSIYDPARMAQNFAGVATTGGTSDLFNEIIVRGNSPRGVLWRLEGIEIPNPNHFGALGNSGGGISMLSSSILSNSEFYTGAFPAEFGNATSGVFDLRMRKGNNEKREYAMMAGILGVETALEGPLGRKGGASYLVNFRYSTLSMLKAIGFDPVGDVLPAYGDIAFHFHFPTSGAGSFSLFGLGGKNKAYFEPEADSTKWDTSDDKYGFNDKQSTGTIGLSHRLLLENDSYLHTVVAVSADQYDNNEHRLDPTNNYAEIPGYQNLFNNYYYRVHTNYNKKINAQHSFKIGAQLMHQDFDFFSEELNENTNTFVRYLEDKGSADQYAAYGQWKFRANTALTLTGGLHYNYYKLTGHSSIEPRLGARWNLSPKHSLHFAIGLHSKPEHPVFYLVEPSGPNETRFHPNAKLDYQKSLHFVVGYNHAFSKDFNVTVEAYYQHLYDVPVETDINSYGSMLNVLDIWDFLDTEGAVNDGRGYNYGLDITLEKYFSHSYYFLLTGSMFDSQFRTLSGKWFDTRFSSKVQLNLLGGKEYRIGKLKNKTIGFSGKFVLNGGTRHTPIDLDQSRQVGWTVRNNDNFLGESIGTYYRFDAGLKYKVNKKNITHSLSLDIQNVTNHLNINSSWYSSELDAIDYEYQTGLFPVINYRIEF